jgi:hypothetical protein
MYQGGYCVKRLKRASEVVTEEDLTLAKSKLIEIKNSSDELMEVYLRLYEDLNDLYDTFPNLYEKLHQVVVLPTNEDAQEITDFNQSLNQELIYFQDDNFLASTISGETYLDPIEQDMSFEDLDPSDVALQLDMEEDNHDGETI